MPTIRTKAPSPHKTPAVDIRRDEEDEQEEGDEGRERRAREKNVVDNAIADVDRNDAIGIKSRLPKKQQQQQPPMTTHPANIRHLEPSTESVKTTAAAAAVATAAEHRDEKNGKHEQVGVDKQDDDEEDHQNASKDNDTSTRNGDGRAPLHTISSHASRRSRSGRDDDDDDGTDDDNDDDDTDTDDTDDERAKENETDENEAVDIDGDERKSNGSENDAKRTRSDAEIQHHNKNAQNRIDEQNTKVHTQETSATTTETTAAAVAEHTGQEDPEHNAPVRRPIRTLWCGDLAMWMDEDFLLRAFRAFSRNVQVVETKVIRNKATGLSEGYGFVEFGSHAAAECVLRTLNGRQVPGTTQSWRLNWASFGIRERRSAAQHAEPADAPEMEYSIYVGDLQREVTDVLLLRTFRAVFPSARSAKVVVDAASGASKGYGFVRFGDERERDSAMMEMNGKPCLKKLMRISSATTKKGTAPAQYAAALAQLTNHMQNGIDFDDVSKKKLSRADRRALTRSRRALLFQGNHQHLYHPVASPGTEGNDTTMPYQHTQQQPSSPFFAQPRGGGGELGNTTLFVGGLDSAVSENLLRSAFSIFGDLVYVKIPHGKGCGFVQYVERSSAERALVALNGKRLGASNIRVSWGRSNLAVGGSLPPPTISATSTGGGGGGGAGGATPIVPQVTSAMASSPATTAIFDGSAAGAAGNVSAGGASSPTAAASAMPMSFVNGYMPQTSFIYHPEYAHYAHYFTGCPMYYGMPHTGAPGTVSMTNAYVPAPYSTPYHSPPPTPTTTTHTGFPGAALHQQLQLLPHEEQHDVENTLPTHTVG